MLKFIVTRHHKQTFLQCRHVLKTLPEKHETSSLFEFQINFKNMFKNRLIHSLALTNELTGVLNGTF